MKRAAVVEHVSVATILILVALGFWLGSFHWFGGYVSTQQAFWWCALGLGLSVTIARVVVRPSTWLWHAGYLLMSQYFFGVGLAFGQVFYFSPSTATEFIDLLAGAWQGQL